MTELKHTSRDRVRRAYERLSRNKNPEAWISIRSLESAEEEALRVDEELQHGRVLPLAGTVFAVKDNIDVAHFETTAGYPPAAYMPDQSAVAVARLEAAGAICIGKTNLDQFATGLVGTRSPYGAARSVIDPDRISGGSSSGSAVAVADGTVDFSLGTDTAGSGRVPAAYNGIIGIKPSLGLISSVGLVPAVRPFDTISVFANCLGLATQAIQVMGGEEMPNFLQNARLAAPLAPVIGIPVDANLESANEQARNALTTAAAKLKDSGATLVTVDIASLLDAAQLLYGSALIAERTVAFGKRVLSEYPLDPSVEKVVDQGRGYSATDYIESRLELDRLKSDAELLLQGFDALLIPTVGFHPTFHEVADDPMIVNTRIGTFTNFLNVLQMSGIAVPVPNAEAKNYGVTIVTGDREDAVGYDLAARLLEQDWELTEAVGCELGVFGAHLRGMPLNGELLELGARYITDVSIAPHYRMVDLGTSPPKPGIEYAPDAQNSIEGELWRLNPLALAKFIGGLAEPMTVGPLELNDGRSILGFGFRGGGSELRDISQFRRWDTYLNAVSND